jgi:hypothetical protein
MKIKKMSVISLLAVITLVFATGTGLSAEPITLQGQVTEDSQFMTDDGDVYEIADTEEGAEVMEMVGEKIEVRGTLSEDEGTREITVESFSVVK